MSDLKIQALDDDTPIARRARPYALRRTVLYDAESWNLMAQPAPIRREIAPWTAPDGLPRGSGGEGDSKT